MITSVNNNKIKTIKKLINDKRYFFLDNPKLIEEAIKTNHSIKYLICEKIKEDKFEKMFDYMDISQYEILKVSNNVFKSLSNTVLSQGIIGVIEKADITFKKPIGNYLVLDEVQDPGNVGTLIRSALGAGFEDIYLINSANITNDKVIRSSMGAIFHLRTFEVSREKFLCEFKTFANKNLIVADMEGENIYKTNIEQPCGVVIGNEGNGISDELKKIASKKISIPMKNNLESLNAGVAGSVIMLYINSSF